MKVFIGASKGISFTSKLIKWWQFGFPYTHVFYIIDENPFSSNPEVIEAWHQPILKGGGVYQCKLSKNHTEGTVFSVFSVEVSYDQKQKIEKFLKEQVGKKYDFLGLLGFPLRQKKIGKNNKWFCSELVFQAFLMAGVELLRYTNPQEVSPRLLLKSTRLIFETNNVLRKEG